MKEKLSQSLEDYIETIAQLCSYDGQAHANDIAIKMKVKKPSVTSALKELARRGLVHYQKYMPITLTKTGEKQADKIIYKHRILQKFFEDILELPRSQATELACNLEHCITDKATKKVKDLSRYLEDCPRTGKDSRDKYTKTCSELPASDRDCKVCVKECTDRIIKNIQTANEQEETMTHKLSTLKPGQGGRVKTVKGSAAFSKRASQMGLLPGSPVKVIRVAPLADPISIEVKGYELSLRKKEAEGVTISLEK